MLWDVKVDISDIQKAQERLRSVVFRTEVGRSQSSSDLLGTNAFFKFENHQRTGSFKIRGAYNRLLHLTEEERKRGVIACSAGNHAQGVALSASLLGVKSTIVMPVSASLNKSLATQGYGATVISHGEIFDEAFAHARGLEKKQGYVFIHPFEDPHIIAGQGTIGLEILEQLPDLDTLVVPIGGGGLMSGIALAVKSLKPQVQIVGVQSVQMPAMCEWIHSQKSDLPRMQVPRRSSTIADGIAVKHPSQQLFDLFIRPNVEDIVTVTDEEIAAAIVYLLERAKALTEGSGAVGLAAAMSGKIRLGKNTCFLLSGGNIDLNLVSQVIQTGQIKRSRIVEISVVVDDLPGSLHRLTRLFAIERANILEVHHDRVHRELFLRETKIDFILEVTGVDHIDRIKKTLRDEGIRLSG